MTFDDLEKLLAQGTNLSRLLPVIKTYTSKELVEEEETKRKRYMNTLQQAKHDLRSQMDQLRAYVRLVDITEDQQKTDCREILSYMFKLIQDKKDSDYGRNPQAQ